MYVTTFDSAPHHADRVERNGMQAWRSCNGETRDEMRQDAVGCVVVEVPAGDEYTNDRRKSSADVGQAHTTTIWQPPAYPIPIGKTNAESSISAHALLFSIPIAQW